MTCLPLVHHSKNKTPKMCFSWRNREKCDEVITRHAFYEEFRLYWIFLKLVGILPYRIDRKGNVRFELLSKEMVYSVIVYTILSVPVCLSMGLTCREKFLSGYDFDRMIFTYMMAGLMIPHFTIPITHWKYYKSHESVFRTWHQFQNHYEEVMGIKLRLHNKCWKAYSCFMFLFAATCAIFFANIFLVKSRHWWEFSAHIYVLSFFLMHLLVFVEQCATVVALARDLKLRTVEAVKSRNATLIADYSSVWLHLSELGGLIGYLFYRMYGHLLLTIFATSTIALYVLIKKWELKRILWHPVAAIAICKAWIYLFCECGERISMELGHKFTLKLLKSRHQLKDEDTRREVDSFLSAIRSFPPVVSLNGYAAVNRKLLMTIYSTMVTYLIVVLQFSQDYNHNANGLSANTTANANVLEEESSSFFMSHLGKG